MEERGLWPGNDGHPGTENKNCTASFSLRILAQLQEVPEDVCPELRVLDFGMELEAEQGSVAMTHRLDVAVLGTREGHEIPRQNRDFVVVRLPHLEPIWETLKGEAGLRNLADYFSKLGDLAGAPAPPKVFAKKLWPPAIPRIRREEAARESP